MPPVDRRGPNRSEIQAKQGKPVVSPVTAGEPKGTLLAQRVKDHGESECHAVTAWIPVVSDNITGRESEPTSMWSFLAK